jgi:hypothetical protein
MRILSFLLLLITNLSMALPSAYLAMLAGLLYYLNAGVGFLFRRGFCCAGHSAAFASSA